MADLRTNFPVLEDASTQAGLPLHKVLEGDAISAKNALAALAAKDGSGNFKYLLVDTNGALMVNTEGDAKINKYARGTLAGTTDLTLVTGAEITLTADTSYEGLSWVCSCFRDALFQIEWVDDEGGGGEAVTVLADVLCGPGDLTDSGKACTKFTTGSTGTQKLRVRAKNFNATSDFRATISIEEIQ